MLEDIDAIVNRHGETSLLALLDGELQIDNIVTIATTNYPELLDKRITNRPSRFDITKYIGMPSRTAREFYILHTVPRLHDNLTELTQWLDSTDKYSLAHLKEVVISVEVFENTLEDTITRLNKMIDVTVTSSDFESKEKRSGEFGFATTR